MVSFYNAVRFLKQTQLVKRSIIWIKSSTDSSADANMVDSSHIFTASPGKKNKDNGIALGAVEHW